MTGCASRKTGGLSGTERVEMEYADVDRSSLSPAQRFSYDYGSAALARMEEDVQFSSSLLLTKAKTAIGTPYVTGGTSLNGFDCSGFVQWVYKSVGIALPRTAREQSSFGVPIETEDMMAGDIVTFRHPRRGYHTGIYVGEGKFIHSPRPRKSVRIASLSDPYFSRTFTGARRVAFSDEADAEITQSLLSEYGRQPKSDSSKSAVKTQKKQKRSTASVRTGKQSGKQQKASVQQTRSASKTRTAVRKESGKTRQTVVQKRQQKKQTTQQTKSKGKTLNNA